MPESRQSATSDRLNPAYSAEDLRTAVRHGSRRTLIAQLTSHIASLIVLASLYHLLEPVDFGLLGMVLPVIMFLRIFTSLGMNVATVQSPRLAPELVSTLFWWHVGLGAASTAVTIVLAPLVGWFYDEPQAAAITVALSGTALASAVGLQHIALLERNLRLGSSAMSRLLGQVVGGVVAIAMAVGGYGVWALVAQQYIELITLAAVAWRLEPWRPLSPRAGAPIGTTLHFGGYFTATQIVFHLLANVDKILVGFLLGARALGFYSQAFNVMMKPVVVLTTPLNSIMLPALSRAADDQRNYAQIVLAFQRLLAVVSFPAAIGLTLVARDTMLVLGGKQWDEAGLLLRALAVTVLAQSFLNLAGSIFISAGRWRAMLAGSLVMLVVLVQGLVVGYLLGREHDDPVLGVAWGYSLTTCLALFLPFMAFCLRLTGVPLVAWARQLLRPMLAALVMGVAVYAGSRALARAVHLPPVVDLLSEITIGVVVYAALAWREIRWCLDQVRRF